MTGDNEFSGRLFLSFIIRVYKAFKFTNKMQPMALYIYIDMLYAEF